MKKSNIFSLKSDLCGSFSALKGNLAGKFAREICQGNLPGKFAREIWQATWRGNLKGEFRTTDVSRHPCLC
jgi:hypothetical protein